MMKKKFLLLSFPLLLSNFLSGNDLTMGDLNGDGEVNLIDTVLMVNHIQGTEYITNSEALKWQADVNGDGLVNSFDVEEPSIMYSNERDSEKRKQCQRLESFPQVHMMAKAISP